MLVVAHFRINQMMLGRQEVIPVGRAIAIYQEKHWLYRFKPQSGISRAEVSTQSNHILQWQEGLIFFLPIAVGQDPNPPITR